MHHQHETTVALLAKLIGRRAAKRLYRGSLIPVFTPAVPEPYHDRLLAARELVQRWLNEEMRLGPLLSNTALVRDYLRLIFAGQEREIFVVLYLTSVHCLIETEILFFGTVDGATIHPREIIKLALQHNASAMILAHNHPSGLAEPSMDDRLITARIKKAAALFDIRLIDHFVISGTLIESLAERGLL